MGIDIEVSIGIKTEDGIENLPYLHDEFMDVTDPSYYKKDPNRPKYRRRYFRNSICFQFMEDYLIHSGRYPNGNYAFHWQYDGNTPLYNADGTPLTKEDKYDYGHGWFTLKELKKVIKSKRIRKYYMGEYHTICDTEEYDGIIHCLKMLRDDVVRNVIGYTFNDSYCPKDSDVIICVAFNH